MQLYAMNMSYYVYSTSIECQVASEQGPRSLIYAPTRSLQRPVATLQTAGHSLVFWRPSKGLSQALGRQNGQFAFTIEWP